MSGKGMNVGVFGMVAVLGLSALLGGCNQQQKKTSLIKTENSELRERNATLEQSVRDKDSKIADLEANCNKTVAYTAPATMQPMTQQPSYQPVPEVTYNNVPSGGDEFQRDANDGRLKATVAGDVLFDSGKATLKESAKKELNTIASEIKNKYGSRSITVEGYTDSDPIRKSGWKSNEALSEARARAVEKYLSSRGVSSNRLNAVGYGASKPKATKKESRRVEIVVN
jgi:outer membrane protein OmpA-like peptidoglycan-associated protein